MNSNVIRKKQLILLGGAVTLSVLYFVHATRYFLQDYMETKKLSCEEILESLQPPFKALLIDVPFLLDYQGNNCTLPNLLDRPLRLAVLNNLTHETDEKYTVIRYEEEAPGRDYWLFHDNATRAIYKLETFNLGNFLIPSDASLFSEYWKRSSLLKCLNLDMKRTGNTSYLPPQASVDALSELSNLLVSFGMYPFLNGGTLLGYYRECGVIPHTADMGFIYPRHLTLFISDLAVFVEQYNPDFLTLLEGNNSSFRIKRRLGTVNDGYEFTVCPRRYSRPVIDIFFMYNNGLNESWVGGTGGDGQKYQYIYPLYNPWCSADLLGRLFWITCTPEEMLEFEYGPNWKRDHLTKRYSWNKSGHNVRKGSKWTESELKKVYVTY